MYMYLWNVTIEITKEIHDETIITRNPQEGALKLKPKQWHYCLGDSRSQNEQYVSTERVIMGQDNFQEMKVHQFQDD